MNTLSLPCLFVSAALTICAGELQAQTEFVSPAGFDYETSGGSSESAALVFGAFGNRAMQVIDASAVGFTNRTITHVSFRFSSFYRQGWASVHDVRLALGTTTTPTGQMPTAFAQVPTSPMVDVFQGPVTVPASTSAQVPEAWSVVVPLQTPWTYDASQGNLVLEVEATWISGDLRAWDADAHSRTPGGGGFQILGAGCNGFSATVVSAGSTLYPGGNVLISFEDDNTSNRTGGAALGLRSGSFPLDLGPLGAPGCTLQFDPVFVQPTEVVGSLWTANGQVTWPIPPSPSLVGFYVDHQVFLNDPVNPTGISLSHAHRIHIGAPIPVAQPATNMISGDAGAAVGWQSSNPRGFIVRFTTI